MDFTKISIKRPVAIIMVMLIIVILGIVSVSKMEMALTPDVDMPIAMVMTTYEDAGPEEVESLVTEKIESAVANVEDIEYITSTSSEGSSMVMVEFSFLNIFLVFILIFILERWFHCIFKITVYYSDDK